MKGELMVAAEVEPAIFGMMHHLRLLQLPHRFIITSKRIASQPIICGLLYTNFSKTALGNVGDRVAIDTGQTEYRDQADNLPKPEACPDITDYVLLFAIVEFF